MRNDEIPVGPQNPYTAIAEMLEQMTSRQQEWVASFRSPFEQLQSAVSHMVETWAKPVQTALRQFPDGMRKIGEQMQALQFLYDHGWIVSPFMYGKPVLRSLVGKEVLEKRPSELNRIYEDFFVEDNYKQLAAMVDSWKGHPVFKPRMTIFRSCLAILREFRRGRNRRGTNPCAVLIPVLVAQLEGMLAFCARHVGFVRSRTLVKAPGKKEAYGIAQWLSDWSGVRPVSDLPGPPIWFWMRFLDKVLFASVYPEGQEDKKLKMREKAKWVRPFLGFSRHKIEHGEDVRYGTIDNLLRTFLALDFLAYVNWSDD